MELLRELVRARALEGILTASAGDPRRGAVSLRPVSPALPAARALRHAADGTGDVFSLRGGSPAAALAMGVQPQEILRQHLGKGTAPAQGRDPGGFPTDLERGLLAPFELPGTLVEVMAGIALAFRMRGAQRVALLVDDLPGTASGDWHEGLNLAAVSTVPLVLVVDRATRRPMDGAAESMADRAPAYGFTPHAVPGTDPREVEKVVWSAVEAARMGGGLQVVEVLPWEEDPVEWLLGNRIAAEALSSEDALAMVSEAGAEMDRALASVRGEADPDPAAAAPPFLCIPGWTPPGSTPS